MEQFESGARIRRVFVRHEGKLVAVQVTVMDGSKNPSGEFFYLHPNHLGSVQAVTRADGSLEHDGETRFLPFGQTRANLAGYSSFGSLGYTGHEHNEALGLIYMNARYYAPAIGRFISPDNVIGKLEDPQAHNPYSYAKNNPVNRMDPDGHLDVIGYTANGGGGKNKEPEPEPVPFFKWDREMAKFLFWTGSTIVESFLGVGGTAGMEIASQSFSGVSAGWSDMNDSTGNTEEDTMVARFNHIRWTADTGRKVLQVARGGASGASALSGFLVTRLIFNPELPQRVIEGEPHFAEVTQKQVSIGNQNIVINCVDGSGCWHPDYRGDMSWLLYVEPGGAPSETVQNIIDESVEKSCPGCAWPTSQ